MPVTIWKWLQAVIWLRITQSALYGLAYMLSGQLKTTSVYSFFLVYSRI